MPVPSSLRRCNTITIIGGQDIITITIIGGPGTIITTIIGALDTTITIIIGGITTIGGATIAIGDALTES